MFTQHAKEILLTLQKDYPQINLEQLKKWGPLVQFQYDASGQNPIQRFVTLLVQMETGKWLLCRQINGIQNGHEWPARPFVREVTEVDAQFWMREHKLA